jgi:DNA modification methylase
MKAARSSGVAHTPLAQRQSTAAENGVAQRKLAIVYRPITELKLDPSNPRVHTRRQIRQITRSIEAFGFIVPVLIDAQGQVTAGHGRVLAARLAGLTQLPTICLDHLTEAQVRAFMIADNKLTENASWDERLLAEQLKALSEVELDFSIDVTGFEMAEIDVLIEGVAPATPGKDDPADAIPGSGTKSQVTQPGTVWILDRHRIYCGDARDDAAYSVVMQGRRAAAVFSDPPYNDPIDGYVAGFGKVHHPEFAMASGEMSEPEFRAFLVEVFTLLARHSADGALQFICMDWRHAPELLAAARQAYTEFKNLCIWVKDVAGQGSLYRSQHELVFVFKSGRGAHRNNIQLGQFGRYRTNVWQYRRVHSLACGTDEGNLSELHPTIKPVELVGDAILDCTARRDVVLDAFLGSGTTVIAAERTGRICYGIEIDPAYVDTTIRRWQTFTGLNAVHESSGRTFNEIEREVQDGRN